MAEPSTENNVPAFLQQMFSANKKHFGDKGAVIGTKRRVIGLEPYSIALQYLIDLRVIPLQSIICFAGEPKSYKTSSLIELCKLAITQTPYPGAGIIIHTEGKWSQSKVSSMVSKEREDLIQIIAARSIEQWQDAASASLTFIKDSVQKSKEAAKKNKQIIPPTFICIDSLTGSQSEKIIENVQDTGYGSKTYQDRAAINWQWFNVWGPNLTGIPVSIVVSNHLKDKIDGMGHMPQKVTSGGAGPSFMCSLEIRVKNIGEIQKTNVEGANLEWRCHFNSLGRDKRKIKIPYIETYDAEDNQLAYFDWDEALINCILAYCEDGAQYRKRVEDSLGRIVEYSKTGVGKVYTCDYLNIDREKAIEEGITASVLGKILQTDPAHRERLRKLFRIQDAELWTPETEM